MYPLATLMLAAGLAAPPATDAPAAGGDRTVTRLGEVAVVASKVEQPLDEVAASVTVIDRVRMDQTQVQDIDDLVRYEPGISVTADASRFGLQGYAIRGLDGNRVTIEVDGVPISDAFTVGSFSRAGRDLVDTEMLERVEVLRGPASSLYGSNALAGVVAYRTRDPADLLARTDDDDYLGFRVSASGRDDSLGASGYGAMREGAWQALAIVTRRDGDQRETRPRPGGLAANPADYTDRAGLAKLGWDGGDAGHVLLTLDATRRAQDTDVRSLIAGPGQYATTTSLLADDDYTRDRVSLRWDGAVPALRLDQARFDLYWQDSSTEQFTDQFRNGATPSGAPTERRRRFDFDTLVRGMQFVGQSRFALGSTSHHSVFGFEFTDTALDERRDGEEINLRSGASTNVVLGETLPVRDFPNSSTRELGAFWQDEIEFGATRLALIPALRYDAYRIDAQPDALYLEDNPTTPVVDVDEHRATPKLGLRYGFGARGVAYLQYARGFRAPPFADVNIGLYLPAAGFIAIPNPELKSETSHGLEAGLRWSDAWGQVAASVYSNHYRNLIESRVNLGRDPDSGLFVFQSLNRDRAEIRGIELSASAALERWLAPGFGLDAALALAHGEDTARNEPLNAVDPLRVVAGLHWESPARVHRVELVGTFADGKERVDESSGALFHAPGYGVLDLHYGWQPNPRVRLELGAFNLTDRRYWLWGSVRGTPERAREVDLYTQPGRNLGGSLTVGW